MKKIKKIGFIALISLFGIFLIGVSLAFIYEDDVKEFAISKIKENLTTTFEISEVDLSIWKQFPNASLEIKDLWIEDTFKEKDTLISAKKVYLEFDIFDLFSGNYVVKEISIQEAQLSLLWNEGAQDNFHFWKNSSASDENFEFDVEAIHLTDTHFILDQKHNRVLLDAEIKDLSAEGAFKDRVFDLIVDGNLRLNQMVVKDDSYAANNQIEMSSSIKIDSDKNEYTFVGSELIIDDLPLKAQGAISVESEFTICNLNFEGENLALENTLALLPNSYKDILADYRVRGQFDAKCEIKGTIDSENSPDVNLDFNLKHVAFKHYQSGVTLGDIVSAGLFEKKNGVPETLFLQNFMADFEGGAVQMNGSCADFLSPDFDIHFKGHLDLENLKDFLEIKTLEIFEGSVNIESQIAGHISDIKNITSKELNSFKIQAVIDCKEASFKTTDMPRPMERIGGQVELNNEIALLKSVEAHLENSDLRLEGRIENMLPFILMENQNLWVDAKLKSSLMDLNNLLSNEDQSTTSDYRLIFPEFIQCRLQFDIDQLTFREFHAADVKGNAELKSQIFTVNPLEFKSSEGTMSGSLLANGRIEDKIDISTDLTIQGINVNQMFAEFENFGQSFLTQEHIKGKASAQISFNALMNSKLELDSKDIRSLIDISIEDGELIELSSMSEIAKYIRTNKWIAPFVNEDKLEEKLSHIYFSEMSNTVEVKGQKIIIPDMTIFSSAMDISVEGTHFFNNQIDYTLGFKIRDILSKDTDTPFGEVEDDGLGNSFFLAMSGTTESPEFSYDRLAHKEKRKEDRQNEKEVFKQVLKDNLGGNKDADSSNEPSSTESEKVEVKVIPDEPKKKKKRWFESDDDEEIVNPDEDEDDDDF